MEKRYQIFISSTFSDLKEERNKVMQTIMSLDCIPAGMELFPAMDEEQFEFIKKIIDDCDYYILIIGARYGSMDENGISYTEKEYDYAISKNIPIMAFLHNDITSITLNKADLGDELRQKLEKFRNKVKTGRLVKYWKNADELNANVAVSLPKTIKMFPRTGWVRANLQTNAESLQEINSLQKELAELRNKIQQDDDTKTLEDTLKDKIASLETTINIMGTNKHYDKSTRKEIKTKWNIQLSFQDIFYKLGLYFLDKDLSDVQLRNKISKISFEATGKETGSNERCQIELESFQRIKIHYQVLKLIEKSPNSNSNTSFWKLSSDGKQMILNSICILKEQEK